MTDALMLRNFHVIEVVSRWCTEMNSVQMKLLRIMKGYCYE
jgi:hypothetical protein